MSSPFRDMIENLEKARRDGQRDAAIKEKKDLAKARDFAWKYVVRLVKDTVQDFKRNGVDASFCKHTEGHFSFSFGPPHTYVSFLGNNGPVLSFRISLGENDARTVSIVIEDEKVAESKASELIKRIIQYRYGGELNLRDI